MVMNLTLYQVAHEMATYKILKRGFVGAVFCVGSLYLIINGVFVSDASVRFASSGTLLILFIKLAAIPYDNVVVFLEGGRSNFAPLVCSLKLSLLTSD
jgi:hypothetical protein